MMPWTWIGLGVLTSVPLAYDYFFRGARNDEPPPVSQTDNLLKFSLILGIAVSSITLYQFWKGR